MKFNLKFLLITLFICSISIAQNKGTISGVLTDKETNNEVLPFANVLLKGTNITANTDIDGKYSLTVNPGTYTIIFSFVGYESVEKPVTVKAGETITVNQVLSSGSYTLKDVVVKSTANKEKETALLLDQKNAVVIKQSIGAQEMSRKGVSDVEEGLTKVTGITKVGSRGIFVRGLEDRYNNLLINDLAAPSNSPYSKIVPLDLFPTNIVGVIDVYKTFNPNIYGDFAGGTFNIQTSKPTKNITKINLGAGYTTGNSFKDFLLSGDADSAAGFFGFNGKDRELPSFLGETAGRTTFTTDQALNSVSGDKGFNVNKSKSPLNSSFNFLHAEKFDLSNNRNVSYLLSLNFDNSFAVREGVNRTLQTLGDKYNNDFINTEYRFKTSTSALVGVNYSAERYKLSFNTLYLKTTLNSILDQYGVLSNNGVKNNFIRTNQLDKTDYLNAQLLGEYNLTEDKNQTLKGGVSYANTKYGQPDRKFYTGTQEADNQINTSYGGNNFLRQYLSVDGNVYVSGLLEYNLKFGKDKQNKLTVGYNGNFSKMESSYRFVASYGGTFSSNDINNIDSKITSDINSNAVFFAESSNTTYKVKLNESANAGYANLFWKFADKFELNGGLRVENTIKETYFRTLGSFDDPFKKKTYNNLYVLPSVNLKYLMTETSNIRFAASKTYTKPVVMESFPISYINADNTSTQGNSLLKNSDNYNVDLKYELFPTAKEMVTFGVFGKYIDNPIERTFIANATSGTVTTFLNSDNATLYGAEVEFLLGLNRISDKLEHFSFGLNASLMSTKVNVAKTYESQDEDGVVTIKNSIETHQTRSLQGASDWLVNSDLKYEFTLGKDWTNTMSLVYGVFGKRIYAVGTNGQDNTYELPVSQLDFVWGSKISDHFDVKFTADNLINPARQLEFGNNGTVKVDEPSLLANSYKKGVGFSVKVGYTF
ncbi:TonB-dependent Receptor Plug Domain [Flavobacterium resistens]|uniref:TonB-dependent Receptor Plug Domain n=1 Tax=Flavobacterium resistens TaxID=443612 RepID=A0A521ECK8_9FLAO|nr:TonB-dependent receptor [Flavobacterium resistens]MRX68959.1 TonB-dependent receptor plug domain-containing protein [Flavobacterium resistens]SMO81657.1 TonB-dependent Receptor Plug Domain [Flavobacterium resistens]